MTKSKSETVNYLLLYEAMVRHQDSEFDATHDHIALTMGRIQHLGRKSVNKNNAPPELMDEDPSTASLPNAPKGMLTYIQMRRCLLRLGYTWNRSLNTYSSSGSVSSNSIMMGAPASADYDDDVSVMSSGSTKSFMGGGATVTSTGTSMATRDIIATDAQLIMLLTTLVEMEERHRAVKLAKEELADQEADEEGGTTNNTSNIDPNDAVFCQGLFLPEFIQAYKLIIGGMQSLQTYPDQDYSPEALALGMPLDTLRLRSRERTLGLLRLFGPDSKLYTDAIDGNTNGQQSAGEDPESKTKLRKTGRDGLNETPNRNDGASSKKKKRGHFAKDGLLARPSEEEIRKMVHSKDKVLAQVLEDHEAEMNVMAVNMEQLRVKSLRQQGLLKVRRKRTLTALAVGMVLLAVGGGGYEYYKREQVKVEIASGRETERQADAKEIKSLKKSVKSLTSKLSDAEATIRYEESRYEEVKKKFERVTKLLDDTNAKWRLDQRELEGCQIARKELAAEMSSIGAHTGEIEEEVVWCRERMESTERAMEGMERALKKSRINSSGDDLTGVQALVVPSFADIAKEIDDGDKMVAKMAAEGNGDKEDKKGDGKKKLSKASKVKPVLMEMKYNKSFRNAVFLRQAYSAVAGMVISSMFPSVSKVIGFLFLR